MKNFCFFIIFLFISCVISKAQSVFPTYEQRPIWCIKQTVFGRPQPEYKMELGRDTIICGKKCNPVISYYGDNRASVTGHIRQEGKKVYQLLTDCQAQEKLLYDFSLQVGDTIRHSVSEIGIVSKVDTENVNGIRRKTMIVDYPQERGSSPFPLPPIKRYWIEGIGSSYEPYGGLVCVYNECESSSNVVCLSTNTGVIFGNCTEGCGIRTAINELSSSSFRFNLVANPVGINTFITIQYDIENDFLGKFYVSNLFGQVLFTKALILYQTEERIDLPWSPTIPGIYLLVFESDRGERQSLRLVAQ